jgi:serine/threonine protein kinase
MFVFHNRVLSIFINGLLLHVLQALKTIYEYWIMYLDLKLANFLLIKSEFKFMDFGIAKVIQNDTTNIVWESQICNSFWIIYLLWLQCEVI